MELDDIQIFHDSHNLELRNPFGAVSVGNKCDQIMDSKRCSAYINLKIFITIRIKFK